MYSILVAVDVFIAAGLIGLVLMQQGKGANAGAAFGGGASSTVFGARGSASFLTRATAILAALFFINSIVLAYLASHRPEAESVVDSAPIVEVPLNAEEDDISDIPVIDASGIDENVDPVIDQIKQEIQRQVEQQTDLPSDVPTTEEGIDIPAVDNTTQDPLSELEQQSQQAQEVLDQALEETQEAIDALPADVPQ